MAIAPSPNDLTRQQLDELDALLQRMLSLPLPLPDEKPAAAPPVAPIAPLPLPDSVLIPPVVKNWRVDPPKPAPNPAPHLLAVPAPAEIAPPPPSPPVSPRLPEVPRPVAPAMNEAAPLAAPVAPLPIAEVERPSAKLQVVEPAAPVPQPVIPQTIAPQAIKPRETAKPEPTGEVSSPKPSAFAGVLFVFWPLVLINKLTDLILGRLGPIGLLLRSGFGKNLLGFAGIGLLLYTLAHIAQIRGWITLPFPVAWPQ